MGQSGAEQFRRFFMSRAGVLLTAFILCIPALFTGYLGDDYIHHALLSEDINIPKANDWSLFGLFSWVDADPQRNLVLMNQGLIPWWTYEGMRYEFWRPLAEISHWLDHQLWHESPAMMHLHSVLWYLALGFCVFRFYQRMGMGTLAALVAFAAYLLDSTHGYTVGWISNRNALMAAMFGVLSVHSYVDWRESKHIRHFWISLAWLITSLFSAEMGITTACYLGAYALMIDAQGPRRGLLALWPFALACIVWWVLYKLGNFGANNSDINYIDPVESPLIFLSKLVERIPVLLFSQFGIFPAELYGFTPQPVPPYVVLACLFLIFVGWLMMPILRQSALARFWALGTFFAVAPISATIPWDRNLIMVGIGGSALIGLLFQALRDKLADSRARRICGRVFLGVHLVLAPLLLPFTAYSPKLWNDLMGMDASTAIPFEGDHENIVMIGVPMQTSLASVPVRFAKGLTLPNHLWNLLSEPADITLTRQDQHTLLLDAPQGLVSGMEEILRDIKRHPLQAGHRVGLDGMTLVVEKVNAEGRPIQLSLQFTEEALSRTRLIVWRNQKYERLPVPALGERLNLALKSAT